MQKNNQQQTTKQESSDLTIMLCRHCNSADTEEYAGLIDQKAIHLHCLACGKASIISKITPVQKTENGYVTGFGVEINNTQPAKQYIVTADKFDLIAPTEETNAQPEIGKKFDAEKPRWDLLPPTATEETVKVLTFGAEKYGDDNWKLLENPQQRYIAAAMRHINAFRQGEHQDAESGLHTLAHAICCLTFILELELDFELVDETE